MILIIGPENLAATNAKKTSKWTEVEPGIFVGDCVKNICPICGKYAILLRGQKMCWDCYVASGQEFKPE